ncbi:2OG-Fe(II) oxygenase family protein [Burkholderia diffusa]|uniref:2OG-Fe(II) oxygenase family protein n=1 Tax=Burkholderia diffusa TaxID=488732 RepID=UPI00157B670A|nr:2OG-Fe(II) oxygenase family protein [Burkholderia diffusa]NTY37436.1 hypothetical protein [Burkholderia diffusa]
MTVGAYLDFDAIRGAPLATDPFRFSIWRNAIPPAMAQRLAAEFPTDGFVRSERKSGGSKTYNFLVRTAIEKNRCLPSFDSLSPAWQAFLSVLTGPAYRKLLGDLTAESIDDYEMDIGFFVFASGNDISIHTDHLTKATTNVIYFSPAWQPEWGGELCLYRRRLDGRFDAFERVLPVVGNALLLVPDALSWHGVNAVSPAAASLRLTLQIETWRPTWRHG